MRLFTLCRCGQAIELWDRVWYHTRNEADDHAAEPKVLRKAGGRQRTGLRLPGSLHTHGTGEASE